jgi:plasmid stabilization system protein ParE
LAGAARTLLTLIRWTPSAFNDLKTISRHIERQRNLATANRVCRIIYDTIQILRRFPESGKSGIEEGAREFVVPQLPSYIGRIGSRIPKPFKSFVSGNAHSSGTSNTSRTRSVDPSPAARS